MAWLNKAKMEPKEEVKKEEPKIVAPVKEESEAPEIEQKIPAELQPESASFYEQKPVVQKVMFLPLQPEMHELITLTKQLAQLEMAIGNMINALVEGQRAMLVNQEQEKKLLEALIKEIELASQGNPGV
jgi:hypothetical protein